MSSVAREKAKKIAKRKSIVRLSLSIALFVVIVCVVGPFELFITNRSEFWFGLDEMLFIVGAMTGAAVVVFGAIGLTLRGKARACYTALLFAVAVGLYLQSNFLNINYGLLDGKAIDWGSYGTYAIINTAVWVVIVVAVIVLWTVRKKLFWAIHRYGAVALMAMQILTLGLLFMTSDVLAPAEDESYYLSDKNLYSVGAKDNIVIFVLDQFDDPLMDTLMEADGEHYQELFAGFTRYTDCAAGGATTAAALPILITGEYYLDGLSYYDYVNGSFNANGLYDSLKREHYNSSIYTVSQFVGTSANGYIDNYVGGAGKPNSYAGLISQYGKFTLFKFMPHVLKQYFWIYSAEFDAYRPSGSYVFDEAKFYQDLITERLHVDGENSFRLYHLMGAHYPYTINEFAEADNTATREQQAKGNLYIVGEYIQQMKDLGIYDDALIVITSDHGDSASYSAPILLVKERGVTDTYAENDAPVSHLDLHPTIFSYLGMNKGTGFVDIPQDQSRDRLFYLRLQEGGSFYMQEYVISDKVAVVGCGTATGRRLAPVVEEKKHVRLGERMGLDANGKGLTYVVSGMETWPMDSVVTQGTEAVFSFPLEGIYAKALDVSIDVTKLYTDDGKQPVQIYTNGQLCHEETVTAPKTIHFTVRPELLTGENLEVKMVLASKWCPLYLSGVTVNYAADNTAKGNP